MYQSICWKFGPGKRDSQIHQARSRIQENPPGGSLPNDWKFLKEHGEEIVKAVEGREDVIDWCAVKPVMRVSNGSHLSK